MYIFLCVFLLKRAVLVLIPLLFVSTAYSVCHYHDLCDYVVGLYLQISATVEECIAPSTMLCGIVLFLIIFLESSSGFIWELMRGRYMYATVPFVQQLRCLKEVQGIVVHIIIFRSTAENNLHRRYFVSVCLHLAVLYLHHRKLYDVISPHYWDLQRENV